MVKARTMGMSKSDEMVAVASKVKAGYCIEKVLPVRMLE